jgi:dihydroxy-acid dehydratase
MSSAFEALGILLPHSSTMANPHDEKMNSAKESAKVLVEAKDIKLRDITPKKAIENAAVVIIHRWINQRSAPFSGTALQKSNDD